LAPEFVDVKNLQVRSFTWSEFVGLLGILSLQTQAFTHQQYLNDHRNSLEHSSSHILFFLKATLPLHFLYLTATITKDRSRSLVTLQVFEVRIKGNHVEAILKFAQQKSMLLFTIIHLAAMCQQRRL
jgi:hypothetical protein